MEAPQRLEQRPEGTVNRLLTRAIYQCTFCTGRTLPCRTNNCPNFTRGGSDVDEQVCFACLHEPAEERIARREVILGRAVDLTEVFRVSEASTRAASEGVLQAFLLLVSLPAEARLRFASSLGICLLAQPLYGDPHAEAAVILQTQRYGLRARASEAWENLNPGGAWANWAQIVQR